MARHPDRTARRAPTDALTRRHNKPCALCRDQVQWVDYKDVGTLRRFVSDRGKIRARRVTGNCDRHQHAVSLAIRTAREMALLPYTPRTTTDRAGGRGRAPRTVAGVTARTSANRPANGDGATRTAATSSGDVPSFERIGALSSSEGGG